MDSSERNVPNRGRARGRGPSGSPQPEDQPREASVVAGQDQTEGGAAGGAIPHSAETMEERAKARELRLMIDYIVSRKQHVKKGSSGRPTKVVANYYGFDISPDFQMRMYSVKVEPNVEEAWKIRRLIATRKDQLRSYITSGLVMYTTRPIQEELLTFQANLEKEPDTNYVVRFEYVRDVERTEPTFFQFYNIVVRQMQQMMEFKLLGRHFFDPEGRVKFPNWRLELWPGFQNSIRQQEAGMMLNVDSVWKVLQTTRLNIMMHNLEESPNFQQACRDAFEGTMVVTVYNKRAYKISRIDFNATPRSTFETKDGPKTYLQYYSEKYGVAIRELNQPMLVSEPRERERRRGQGDIYLVPELCFPCGLNEELRSNFRLMKELASCLHMPPTERVDCMQRFVARVNQNESIVTTMRKWGIRVKPQPVECDARVLKPEDILVGGNQRVTPDDKADWTNAFRSQRMLTPMKLTAWVILVTARDSQGVGNLVGTMQRVAGPLGYHIQEPKTMRVNDVRQYPQKVEEALKMSQGRLDLVFAILPNNNPDNYAAVKRRCSVDYGIPSQCFLSKNMNNFKGLMSICTKMVIQMNAKQGGEPWGVVNPLKNVMVLGYDVHHAGPKGGSSVGAMCAAITPSLGKFFSCLKRMPVASMEVATSVATMFARCLDAYEEKNADLPARIFMYRDGVGEGQLKDVFELEIQAFKDRIAAKYGNREHPKLTYVVVNKRISTRFFQPQHNRQFQNPRPGLIVDDTVTRPERYDFFLVSQTARQGCVSPTYYNVLHDESLLAPDKLQMYTFKLCHLYFNWSGTVAVPAPCQNAHKLALQAGTALKGNPHNNLSYLLHFL